MKKFIYGLTALTFLGFIGLKTYQWLSPKIIVINSSKHTFNEVIVQLPISRVSFENILPNSVTTIYFSKQNTKGKVIYSIFENQKTFFTGELSYNDQDESGRKIILEIDSDGQVNGNVN